MLKRVPKRSENSVARVETGEQTAKFEDNRSASRVSMNLQETLGNRPATPLQAMLHNRAIGQAPAAASSTPIQRRLFHRAGAPFTSAEATQWNALVDTATELDAGADYISNVEDNVWTAGTAITVAGSLAGLRTEIRTAILTRRIARTDADALNWGEFAPFLSTMAARYGARTGPVSTGGHSSQTYTYTVGSDSVSIAEETNAHGQTQGNLGTRRGQMRNAIDLYNGAVAAHAARYA